MARVAIVESYPYEAVWGGDAVYLDRIRTYLTDQRHSVLSYVTDIARGRTNPLLKLRSKAGARNDWIVRNAIAQGGGRFLAYDTRLLRRALTRMPGRRAPQEFGIGQGEQAWLIAQLERARPDLILLAFGACAFASAVAHIAPVLAAKGFFSDRRIRLGEPPAAPPVPDSETLRQLQHADCATFNNLQDLQHYRDLTGATNGALLGMSFRPKAQPPADGVPIILFVGVRTKPNIESMQWFIDGIWPLVRKAVPLASLRLVGTIGASFAHRTAERIEIAGFADDLDAEYRRAQIVIAPLVSGSSGVKTKVAEALSYGRPLVTTSLGVDPIQPDQFADAVDVSDDPELYAAALVDLLTNEKLRRAREAQAKIQFERHFSEAAAYGALDAMLSRVDGRIGQAA